MMTFEEAIQQFKDLDGQTVTSNSLLNQSRISKEEIKAVIREMQEEESNSLLGVPYS